MLLQPAPQAAGDAGEDGVVEGCTAQVLGRAMQPGQPRRGERDLPAGPDLPVERRAVTGCGELPHEEADQVSAAPCVVIGMRPGVVMGRSGGLRRGIPEQVVGIPHQHGAVCECVMDAPDECHFLALYGYDVDAPQGP